MQRTASGEWRIILAGAARNEQNTGRSSKWVGYTPVGLAESEQVACYESITDGQFKECARCFFSICCEA